MAATSTIPAPFSASLAPAALQTVTKRYRNGVVALDGLSLTLRAGEITALLGPNGAGKSTAVKLLMGLAAPTAGQVRIFGQDPRHATARLRTGVMLQVGHAPETLRVREHIELFRGYYPTPLPTAELLRAAGLEAIADRLFGQLSGGQKQRVLFALALAGDPDLVFLDEPTVGLDIEARRGMWREIRALADRGKTVLLTTHYLEEADALAHRIVVINKGQVICQGTPVEVKAHGTAHTATEAGGAGLKHIRCATALAPAHLARLPGVTAVESLGSRLQITSTTPEATLRHLLAEDATLGELEISTPALEDAFLALTAKA